VKPRSVRKLWKDPMTKDGEWGLVSMEGTPVAAGGGVTPTPGAFARPTPTPKPRATPNPGRTPLPGEAGTTGPVLGVYSKSTKKGYRLWEGREAYNEWRFTEASLNLVPGGREASPGPGIGGAPPGAGGGGK